jgi:hypothetical protein
MQGRDLIYKRTDGTAGELIMDNREDKTLDIIAIIVIAILVFSIGLCVWSIIYANQYTEYEYQLTEIQDGIYGTYSTVVSDIPAQNYDIITLCCNGNIRTFKGTIHISYTDGDVYVKYKDSNTVNADELWVYVPFGTIDYQGTTGMGRRR